MKLKSLHYSWVMVILSILVMIPYSLLYYIFGIFLIPMTAEFGWERGALSAAISLAMLVSGVVGIVTGRLCDKYGPRALVSINGLLSGVGLILMSRVSSLWHVYLIWGLLIGISFSFCRIPIVSTIPRWFVRKRGLAQGLTATGGSIGGIIAPPLAQWLISSYGWQQAYIVLGFIILAMVIPVAQFMKSSPRQMGLEAYGQKQDDASRQIAASAVGALSFAQIVRDSRFWILGLISFSFLFCIRLINMHIAPYAIDIGILALVAASIPAIIAAFNLVGKLTLGVISDKLGARRALSLGLSMLIVSLVWLLFARDVRTLYLFAVVFGFAYGGEILVSTLVSAELFPLKHLGVIIGATSFWGTVGGAIGVPLAGAIFDATGNYRLAFLISIAFSVFAMLLCLILLRSRRYEDASPLIESHR